MNSMAIINRTAILVLGLLLSACATTGTFNSATLTGVELSEDNYSLVATGVRGEAEAAYVLGVSTAFLSEMRTVALARVSGSGSLYAEALEDLWRNFEAEHGSATGRSLALVNVRFDSDALNLLVYTRPRISVRADVVEFED